AGKSFGSHQPSTNEKPRIIEEAAPICEFVAGLIRGRSCPESPARLTGIAVMVLKIAVAI
ncbi:MAG: hypothetical protein AB1846_03430, partial [Chloroflexota bacterium]